jgi:hypothetical protein
MKIKLDTTMNTVKLDLITLHDNLMVEAEKGIVESQTLTRLDHALEGILIDRLELGLSDMIQSSIPSNEEYDIQLSNWSVNSQPITGSVKIPVPSSDSTDQISGISSTTDGKALIGVFTTFYIELEVSDSDRKLHLKEDTTIEIKRNSLADLLSRRLDRFQISLKDGEFTGLLEYIVGSLAQMKCMMGYGRTPGEGEITPLSLLSNGELLNCMDLSLLLLSQSYLRSSDHELLSKINNDFRIAPGAGGDISIEKILSNASSKIDPAMLPLLGEGLFNEDNPPSLELMLRPMFYSIMDLIVNRLVTYIGLDEEMLMMVGGLKAMFDLGVEATNSISRSIIGEEIIDAGQEGAFSIFKRMLERSLFMDPEEDSIFIGAREGIIWNGSRLEGYPRISIPDIQRTFKIGLSDGCDEDIYYRAPNGTIHPMSEYFDETEEFYGARCNVYEVTADYCFSTIEPPFSSRNLLRDPDFIESLALFLGSESGSNVGRIDSELMMKGKLAIRKVIDTLFDGLTSTGNDHWERMWIGWSTSDPPSLDCGLPPIGSMIDLQVQPIVDLALTFASSLIKELDALDFVSSLAGMEEQYHTLISDWILMNYDRWAGKDEQMIRCREGRDEILYKNCSVSNLEINFLKEEIVCTQPVLYSGKDNIDHIVEQPEISIQIGLGLSSSMDMDAELVSYWSNGVVGSFSEVRSREFGEGKDGSPIGWIRNELNGPSHRGTDLTFTSFNGDTLDLANEVEGLLLRGIFEVGSHFERDLSNTGGRFLVPPPPNSNESVTIQDQDHAELFLYNRVKINRDPAFVVSLVPVSGTYNSDPLNGAPPYQSKYQVVMKGDVSAEYIISAIGLGRNCSSLRSLDVHVNFPILVRSNWEMYGFEYEQVGTLWDHVGDIVNEAKDTLKRELNTIIEDILGDSMSSLREVPPIVVDLVKGKDLDLFEVARVFSNITMDLSSTLRETVEGIVKRIMEMGVRGVLITVCEILGIDEIDLTLDIGPFSLQLHTERRALMGEEGTLLNITMDILPVGMHCYMSFNRIGNATYDFNGTVTFDIGPLFIKMELDPFMKRAPHMISLSARLQAFNDKVLRASFDIPALEEFKSCQVSIGDTLGVEPFIPIPPLGIQAVFDAGFRIKYRMPEELQPHINEVNISSGNITDIEIFNPRKFPIYGSTLEMADPSNGLLGIWRLEPESNRYNVIGINRSNLWRWSGSIPQSGIVRIVLRSPSGIVLDDLEADLSETGWFSRDADGFGIWRFGEGTPGYQNGGSLPTNIKTLLISIALTSIKEAWTHAYETFGISFDMVVPFLEKAIDLFMERFLALVRELVIDVRMFISLEIEDSSGSAGGGYELSFQADGEAVSEFLGWLYDNIKIFISNLADPQSAGNYRSFPWEILSRCYIGLDIFMEMEMPVPVAKMAPEGANLPDSFMLAITSKVNLAIPLKLMGKDVGGGLVSLGVYVMDAPDAIVSLFYDIGNIGLQQDFYLLRATIWEEFIEVI